MDDWRRAGDFEKAAHPGDLVTDEIVETFLNVLPPATNSATLVQWGEPVSHQYDPDTPPSPSATACGTTAATASSGKEWNLER